jgi:thiol-disulfide isomerase/thioredoxin
LKNKRYTIFFLIFWCVQVFVSGEIWANGKPIEEGARLPSAVFEDSMPNPARSYLGLSAKTKTKFSIRDFSGTVFLVEVFNTYCTSCPRNIPVLNSIYSAIEKDPKLKGQAKVLAIAVGNNRIEVENFTKEYKVLYPVITDFDFAAHDALGNPRVPFTILLRRSPKGDIVVKTHQGVLESVDDFLKSIVRVLYP